jgi:hypothetical protein
MLLGLIIKPILIIRIVDYTWHDIFSVFIPCLRVTVASLPIPFIANYYITSLALPMWLEFILIAAISVLSVAVSSWYLGLTPEMRTKVVAMVRKKIGK